MFTPQSAARRSAAIERIWRTLCGDMVAVTFELLLDTRLRTTHVDRDFKKLSC